MNKTSLIIILLVIVLPLTTAFDIEKQEFIENDNTLSLDTDLNDKISDFYDSEKHIIVILIEDEVHSDQKIDAKLQEIVSRLSDGKCGAVVSYVKNSNLRIKLTDNCANKLSMNDDSLGQKLEEARDNEKYNELLNYIIDSLIASFTGVKAQTSTSNVKDMAQYSDKTAFLVSDEDWRAVLSLVPVAIWSKGSESCHTIYNPEQEINNPKCAYPILVYHAEDGFIKKIDVDSIIHFLDQFSVEKVIIDNRYRHLMHLLITKKPLGAGLSPTKDIKKASQEDYLKFWNKFEEVVIVGYNQYESGLIASSFASLINAPLIFINSGNMKSYEQYIAEKTVYVVGTHDGVVLDLVDREAKERKDYSNKELQSEYLKLTKTDKVIITNPEDLNIKVTSNFETEKTGDKINNLYTKTSITSPILSAGKDELIITTKSNSIGNIRSKIGEASLFVESETDKKMQYLTIVGDPRSIPMSSSSDVSADAWEYSRLDDDNFLDFSVGRIFGITPSDVSSYMARSLFYEKTLKNEDKMLFIRGTHACWNSASVVHALGKAFSRLGYQSTTIYQATQSNINYLSWDKSKYAEEYPLLSTDIKNMLSNQLIRTDSVSEDWKDKSLIFYSDHGMNNWAGIKSQDLPYLDNSFVVVVGCLTCSFETNLPSGDDYDESYLEEYGEEYWHAKNLFCANAIRKGSIGYIGAVSGAGELSFHILANMLSSELSIGKAFKNMKNDAMALLNGNVYREYLLIGDPTLKIKMTHKIPKTKLELTGKSENKVDYLLSIPAMKLEVPRAVKYLTEWDDSSPDIKFKTAFVWADQIVIKLDSKDFVPSIDKMSGKWTTRLQYESGYKTIESVSDGWKLISNTQGVWLISPSGDYFNTVKDEFTYFEFPITLTVN